MLVCALLVADQADFTPQVDAALCTVEFVAVDMPQRPAELRNQSRASLDLTTLLHQNVRTQFLRFFAEFSQNRFIVEVNIKKGPAAVYLTRDGKAYFRRSGSLHRMSIETIKQRQGEGKTRFFNFRVRFRMKFLI
jgi:hypothetical protein